MLWTVTAFAQFGVNGFVYGIGDNREFANSKMAYSQTIMGTQYGVEADFFPVEGHHLRLGFNHFFEFGADIDEQKPKLTAYYLYDDRHTTFSFGAFPRSSLANQYPLALLTDTLLYYRPNIEGLLVRRSWRSGYEEAFVDWTGRQTVTRREAFMACAAGSQTVVGPLSFRHFMTLYHNALKSEEQSDVHIEDNFAIIAYMNCDFSAMLNMPAAYIRAGTFVSTFRERHISTFENAQSFFGELRMEIPHFFLNAVYSCGDGHHIIAGDRMYRARSYMRADTGWNFINLDKIKGHFNWSFHLVDGYLDHSQQLSLIYRLEYKK
jgi:hypothetical protein